MSLNKRREPELAPRAFLALNREIWKIRYLVLTLTVTLGGDYIVKLFKFICIHEQYCSTATKIKILFVLLVFLFKTYTHFL